MVRNLRDTSTYANSEKLKELFENHTLNKSAILKKTGLSQQSKSIQRALRNEPVNKLIINKLADFFEINYDELISKDYQDSVEDRNRVILRRVKNIDSLNQELGNIQIIQKKYNFEKNYTNISSLENFFNHIETNNIQNASKKRDIFRSEESFANEIEYLKTFAQGNSAINDLERNGILIYFGKWNSRYIKLEELSQSLEDDGPYSEHYNYTAYLPNIETMGFLLFDYNSKNLKKEKFIYAEIDETKVSNEKIIFPNRISHHEMINHYKKIIEIFNKVVDDEVRIKNEKVINHLLHNDDLQGLNYHADDFPIKDVYFQEDHRIFDKENRISDYLQKNKLTQDFNMSLEYTGEVVDIEEKTKKKEVDM